MRQNYPFMKFILKDETIKGHANSMNIILKMVKTPYIFHMEDDWVFFKKDKYLSKCMDVLSQNDKYGQCLINRNYAETYTDYNILGGIKHRTEAGTHYMEHYHGKPEDFVKRFGKGLNCTYWPHYSLRPGVSSMKALASVGPYNNKAGHFEMEYAYRYTSKGYITTFLDSINSRHIGRLTTERHDPTKENAYTLNKQSQFTKDVPKDVPKELDYPKDFILMNLKRRPDRLKRFMELIQKRGKEDKEDWPMIKVFEAVDGKKISNTRQLNQLFNPNDYNWGKARIGCALSHLTLWCDLVNSNNEYIVVIEDDASPLNHFNKRLKHILRQLKDKKDWDVVFLGHHYRTKYITDKTFHKTMMPTIEKWSKKKSLTQSMGGTGGYIISRSGAQKMLEFIQNYGMVHCIDTMMQIYCDNMNVYYTDVHLFSGWIVENGSVDSDIETDKTSLHVPLSTRIEKEKEFYEKLNYKVFYCDNVEKPHPDDHITFCSMGCKNTTDVRYHVGKKSVHIPEKIFNSDNLLKNIGLRVPGGFSVHHLINYFK
jgi:GR25 family glycosyltransferase involved in LPS biosynthesis